MSDLNKIEQLFIVQQFAMFSSPKEIIELVKEEFDAEVTKQQIHYYNGDLNKKLPKTWRKIFDQMRKEFLEGKTQIAIGNKYYRLHELDKIYKKQKSQKLQNEVGMKDTLQQAAKEDGDAFTNKREHSGLKGEPIQHTVVRVPAKITPEEWKQQAQSIIQPATETEQ